MEGPYINARPRSAQPRDLSYELARRADEVVLSLLGPPNRKQSSKSEWRYGRHGSFRVVVAGRWRGSWNDFERGERGDLLDLIRRAQGCSFAAACEYACNLLGIRQDRAKPSKPDRRKPATAPEPQRDNTERIRRALQIWDEAEPITGTPGALYLARRGIDLAAVPDVHSVLRWHGACPFGESGGRHASIVALWTDIPSVEPRAIHRRPITAAGEKVDRWKAIGPSGGCVIRLWPDESIEQGLVLGEGVETTLSAATRIEHRGTLLRPAWAAGDAGHLHSFPVLSGIDALTPLVDHDAHSTGQDAAAECKQRWTAAGREVIRLVPRAVGADFNDIVREVAP
jgi:hypothetical protein